jgi:hypothetical protein
VALLLWSFCKFKYEGRRVVRGANDLDFLFSKGEAGMEEAARLSGFFFVRGRARNSAFAHAEHHDKPELAPFGAVQGCEVGPIVPFAVAAELTQDHFFIRTTASCLKNEWVERIVSIHQGPCPREQLTQYVVPDIQRPIM